MAWLVDNMQWVMLISGVLTSTMIFAAIAPQAALTSMFGETLEGPLAEIVVRNWGALIAISGGMLIYGAYELDVRPFVLVVVGASKVIFSALVLSQGGRYMTRQAGVAVAMDLVIVGLFAAYLAATP
ncbi:MAG: hypothetical protein ABL996_18110 [Micropepsaceae bacterium]